MIVSIDKLFIFLFMLIPVFLITGPAIPDIIATFSGIYFLLTYFLIKNDRSFTKDKFFLISILFWLSLIFISFFAYDRLESFQDSLIFIRFLIIPTIAYFFFFNNEKKLKTIIVIIFFSVCFVSLDTLYQYFNYNSENGFGKDLLGFQSSWYGRLTGPFGDELVPGAYISKFGLLGSLFFFFIKKKSINIYFEITYLSILGLICFGSGERMALATYFLGILFLFLFMKNRRFTYFISILISLLLIFLCTLFHPFYNDYEVINSTHLHQGLTIQKYYNCEELSDSKCSKIIKLQPSFIEVIKNFKTSAYGEIYNVSLHMFKDNPLTGIGISNFQIACLAIEKYQNKMINYNCASHPHNNYIQFLSEGGIIGLLFFLIFIISIIYIIIKSDSPKIIKFISLATILILFWPLMSTGSLIKNWNGVLTFYIIALCISLKRIRIK